MIGLCRPRLRLRRCSLLPLWVCLLPCALLELCSFWLASIFWPSIRVRDPNSLTILLVADPQLIGHKNEPKWIGWLSRWDADRYLRRGFAHALAATQPDLELFLGDLFDEGVFMDDEQFERDHRRFLSIFPLDEQTNRIHVPGDNDIGGDFEPVYRQRYERFKARFTPHFGSRASEVLGMLCIYERNPFNYDGSFDGIFGNPHGDDNSPSIRILLSHFPVVPRMTARMEQELRRVNIVLSAHDHTTALYMQWRQSPQFRRIAAAAEVADARWTISMTDPPTLPLVEFKAPTVSYRMGVPAMGYGLVTLRAFPANGTASVRFSVLWLPSRYVLLGLYAVLALLGVLCTILANKNVKFWTFCPRRQRIKSGSKKEKDIKKLLGYAV